MTAGLPGRTVLVLSGGGAKAMAHLGAVAVLAKAGVTPSHIVATSMGAVLGAGIASGLSSDELRNRTAGITRRDVAVPLRLAAVRGLLLPSLLRSQPLERTIAALVPARRFDQLRIPLTVTAVERETGAVVRFGAGGRDAPLLDVLYAACALPVMYPPGRIGGREYVDGGLRSPLPLAQAAELGADLVIAVDAGPGFEEAGEATPPRTRLPPLVEAHNDAVGTMMAALAAEQLARWRLEPGRPPLLYVRPRVERHATFRVDRLAEYFAEGERAMTEALANWRT
ncbi:MAG TPA: patatin-like phospholipase family protein [Gemmatimonadales bacterium]|nr:patatin-like phospholipase family protein [Gemmatimonadales bacterium]